MKLSIENAGKVTIEGKFPCAVCRKGIGSNSILCQFCKCRVHKRCSGIRITPPPLEIASLNVSHVQISK